MLRLKTPIHDIAVFSVYVPPPNADGPRAITEKLFQWLHAQFRKLPSRTTPIVCMDANARLGAEYHNGVEMPYDCASVGPCQPEGHGHNSQLLLDFLITFKLVASNTFRMNEPTYVSGSHGTTSRIDYILVPWSTHHTGVATAASVCVQKGVSLQLVQSVAPVDHRPLKLSLTGCTLRYHSATRVRRFSPDALMLGVIEATHRPELLRGVEDALEGVRQEWSEAMRKRSPSDLYRLLLSAIRPVAMQCYFADNCKDEKLEQHRAHRQRLLQSRRALRRQALQHTVDWTTVQTELANASRAIKSNAKEIRDHLNMCRLEEMEAATHQRRFALAYILARTIAGTKKRLAKAMGSHATYFTTHG
eukprot:6462645-Amphidinium_carterae.1